MAEEKAGGALPLTENSGGGTGFCLGVRGLVGWRLR